MLQPAYKQWVMAGTRSPGVGRFGGHAPLSTQRLHQSTFREWSEAQEAQLAVWRPLELWDCVCKGLCVRAHTVDEQKVPKCVPIYVLLWACLADRHMCCSTHAMHMPQVVWTCGVASGGRWNCRLWPPPALPSVPMWCHYSSPALESWASKQVISRPDIYGRPRVLLGVSNRYHSKRA